MRKIVFANFIIIILSCFILSSAAIAKPSNKWRLEFSGKARSDGEIVVELTTIAGKVFTVSIPIKDGTSENKVAKEVVKVMKRDLPEEVFHIERDDGEDVLIKKRRKAAWFDVKILANTVEHVRINPDRE